MGKNVDAEISFPDIQPRYLGFFKVNKCKHMLPHAFQSSHYALWETKFDFPLCVIYNAKVH